MKRKYEETVPKNQIRIYCTKKKCYVTGPTRVCDALLLMGASRFPRRNPEGVSLKTWALPIEKEAEVREWYNGLPEEITEFTVNLKRKLLNEKVNHLNVGEIVTIDYGEGLVRAFQVIAEDGELRRVREIETEQGRPCPNQWKHIEYTLSPADKTIDQRPVSFYEIR